MGHKKNRTRLYSEKEMGALIQRATELQQVGSNEFECGLSIQDIERIAEELGLDPAHLRQAALELESHPDTLEPRSFWGTPFQIDLKRVVEGSLTDEQWEEIVLMLRTLTGRTGKTNDIGKSKEWFHFIDEGLGHIRVTVSPRDEQSTVKIQRQYRGIGVFTYLLSFLVGGAAMLILSEVSGAVVSAPAGLALLGTGCSSALLMARAGLSAWSKRQQQKLQQLMNKVLNKLPALEDREIVEPLIDLPDFSEIENEAHNIENNRTRT